MVDFLATVDTDSGKQEPLPVTLVSGGAEVPLGGLSNIAASYFGPTSYTFTGPNQTFVFPCAGAAAVIFELTSNFTGTINSGNTSDVSTAIVSPARLIRTGASPTGRSTIAGTGAAYNAQYRATAGGMAYVLSTSSDFVGTATVAIFGTAASTAPFINGSVQTPDEQALRGGRAYSLTTGVATVAAGNSLGLYITNPATSGQRVFLPHRLFTCSRTDATFAGVGNPTRSDLLPSVANSSNRGSGGASPVTARSGALSAANLSTLTASGTAAAGNVLGGGQVDLVFERTLEPGQAFANYLTNTTGGGLASGTDMYACITFVYYLEPI